MLCGCLGEVWGFRCYVGVYVLCGGLGEVWGFRCCVGV